MGRTKSRSLRKSPNGRRPPCTVKVWRAQYADRSAGIIVRRRRRTMRLAWHVHLFLISVIGCGQPPTPQPSRTEPVTGAVGETPLVPPMLLQKEALEAGNPLAPYAAMLDLEPRYRSSNVLAGIYAEVRFNFEEFLGFPMAGVQAMALPNYRTKSAADGRTLPAGFQPEL